MSKAKKPLFSNPAFKEKTSVEEEKNPPKFNLVTQTPANAFHSVFDTKPLTEKEESELEELIVNNYIPELISEDQVPQDIVEIKAATKEIKAIGSQGAFLIGERVAKVREILKHYKKETFTSWLENTFGSRRSGYNFLSYYELWNDLPDKDVKEKFRLMPRKAAYMLATRTVRLKDKVSFIEQFFDLKLTQMIFELRKRFPSSIPSKQPIGSLSQISDLIEKLSLERFSQEDYKTLKALRQKLGKLIAKGFNPSELEEISFQGKNATGWSNELIQKAAFNGERFIIKGDFGSAAIVPLEDLQFLVNREKS